MRAVVLREPGTPVRTETVQLDEPRKDEVLVRVAAAGVCRSDLHFADGALGDGRWPMVLGHEGAGVVESVGADVTHVSPGHRVAFSFVPSCGVCRQCRAGRTNLCEPAGRASLRGTMLDGTSRLAVEGTALQHCLLTSCFAEYAVVSAAGAIPLPDSVPLWQAALLGCAVVTGVGAVWNTAKVRIGESVAVVGCGGVGLQVIAGAHMVGASPIVAVDREPAKLELALRHGATHAVDSSSERAAREVKKLTDGGVAHAFEVVGLPETIRLAWDSLRIGGTAVVIGLAHKGVDVALPAIEFLSEKSILGCYYGSSNVAVQLPQLARLAAEGRLDLTEVVSDFTELEGVEDALERLRRGEGARTIVLLDPAAAEAPA
jgi:S-(hydroxymethyl)glutathione dehydrogenase/alcohol dehydrogenase